ncbi:sugar transferase [Actinomycetospora flava]|uniref:Sugar transferase n=1 Tax=Actinomycetospora flava TaxID=3129232 RepID=A0ABU8M534_9PSEU
MSSVQLVDLGALPAEPVPGSARATRDRRRFRLQVVAADLALVAVVVVVVAIVRIDIGPSRWSTPDAVVSASVIALLVIVALLLFGCWDVRVLARGAAEAEYVRILRAIAACAVAASLLALATKDSTLRPWVFVVLPLLAVLLLASRRLQRARLHRARRRGRHHARVLAVGPALIVGAMVERSRRAPEHGWLVVAACASDGGTGLAGVPVVGGLDDVVDAAQQHSVDVVAVGPGASEPRTLHRLAWALEGSGRELVVDPGLMEVSGPRLRMEVMDGLPLLRVGEPRWRGPARWFKTATDRLLALVAVTVLAPLIAVVAVAVRADGGPVLYRQVRVGRDGVPFEMLKFRSMAVDADRRVGDLMDERDGAHDGAGPLFKLRLDPRITPVGRVLRRYSLDELPQLFNVLGGSMSLVGPRPPLPSEVDGYADDVRRRLVVRPGMTGLWQVSGRSDLTWEESVRLDLRYVENWSHSLDLSILGRTVRAVLGGRGAY